MVYINYFEPNPSLIVPNEDRIVGIRYISFTFVSLKFDVVTQWVIG